MGPEVLIALQAIITITRALAQGNDPTPEQLAALDSAENLIKKKLDDDLAKVAAGA